MIKGRDGSAASPTWRIIEEDGRQGETARLDAAPPVEMLFVLDGQVWVLPEQFDWLAHYDVAGEAVEETRRLIWVYWGSLVTHQPIIENGNPLDEAEVRSRLNSFLLAVMELVVHSPRIPRAVISGHIH